MSDRILWLHGDGGVPPSEGIGVLEVDAGGLARAVLTERREVNGLGVGHPHQRLATNAWGEKVHGSRRWSMTLDCNGRVEQVRSGSCGDPLGHRDVQTIIEALDALGLHGERTAIWTDVGALLFPWRNVSELGSALERYEKES